MKAPLFTGQSAVLGVFAIASTHIRPAVKKMMELISPTIHAFLLAVSSEA